MKKKGALVLMAVFLFLGVSSVIESGEIRRIEVDFKDSNIRTRHEIIDSQVFDLIEIDDLSFSGDPGSPCLPSKAIAFYVPEGKSIKSVSATSIERIELGGDYFILPRQPVVPISSSILAEPVPPDPMIYSMRDPYPNEVVELASMGAIAGRRIATLRVFPLQYIPGEKRLVFNAKIDLEIELEDDCPFRLLPLETRSVRQLRNSLVARLVENPEEVFFDFDENSPTMDEQEAVEYLIICLDQHIDEYEVLKNWKIRKGIPAEIISLQSLLASYPGRDDPEKIRNCIKDYYLTKSTNWVLLTLSAPKAKIRGCYCRVGDTVDESIPCDLYFADMDGNWNADGDSYWGETNDNVDLYPDVFVGRITANTGLQASTVVQKILTYEGCNFLPTDYELRMLFLAEYADAQTDGAINKNMIDNESVPPRFDPITKLYESSGNLNHSSAMQALNSGMGIINHDGHGNTNLLSIGPSVLTTDDMQSLTNAPRYSIFYTLACYPGNFESPLGCFARGFLEAPNGGGFFIGNSRYGWYWPGYPGYGPGDVFDREFFKSLFVRNFDNLGVVHADAKIQRIPWSTYDDADRWTQFTSNLFGDPETPVWKDRPRWVVIDHPDTVGLGQHQIEIEAYSGGNPLSHARVCLWMDPSIYEVDFTGSNGKVRFNLSIGDTGRILVTVSKNGYMPYLGSIAVNQGMAGVVYQDEAFSLAVVNNPIGGRALFSYSLPGKLVDQKAGKPKISIYDVLGRQLDVIELEGLKGVVEWDSKGPNGKAISSGIYYARLSLGTRSAATKFIVLR